jgi:hypothetical protein
MHTQIGYGRDDFASYWKFSFGVGVTDSFGVIAFNQVPTMKTTSEFESFQAQHEAQVSSLTKEESLAYVKATVSGNEADYQKVITSCRSR